MNLTITSKGSADTMITTDGNKRTSKLSWDGNMKKGKGKLHIKMDNNGKKMDQTMNFTEKDLVNLLTVPSVNQDIDRRLFNDYMQKPAMQMEMVDFSSPQMVELGEFPEEGLENLTVLPLKQPSKKGTKGTGTKSKSKKGRKGTKGRGTKGRGTKGTGTKGRKGTMTKRKSSTK